MKKTIALTILAIFVFSLIPFAFAENSDANTNSETTASAQTTSASNQGAGVKARVAAREELRVKNKERLQKIADLDKAQIERLSRLEVKNVDKIVQLKKDKLERLTKLSEDKIQRLAELDKDKLDKVSDLSEDEINKVAALGRARLAEATKKDIENLRNELKNIKVMKVRSAEDLDERNISDVKLAQLRTNFEKSKENFKRAKDEIETSRKELNEAVKNKDAKNTLDAAKKFLSSTVDALISHLEKIKTNVQESKNIPEDTVKAMVADMDAEIANVTSIKAEIPVATTKEQVKEIAKKLREEWNKVKQLTRLHADRVISARVEGVVNQGLVLEKRLDNILAKAKEKGIEVNVNAEVNSFSEKIAASKDAYTQAQAKISEALDLRAKGEPADSDKIKQLLADAEGLLKQARGSLKEAHDMLKTIVKKIKEVAPDANLSEESEVEVAQETSASTTEMNTTASAQTNTIVST